MARAVCIPETNIRLDTAVSIDTDNDTVLWRIRGRWQHLVRDPLDDRNFVVATVREVEEPREFLFNQQCLLVSPCGFRLLEKQLLN